MTDRKSQFEMSIDTRTLYDLLIKANVGDTVTFTAMSEALGRPVQGSEPSLQSALRHAFNQDECAFGNVRTVGYRRLTDAEIVGSGEIETSLIRRRAKKAGKRLSYVENYDKMTPDEKIKHNSYMSIFSALSQITKTSAIKKIEGAVAKHGESLPLAKTLEAFKQ